jgi:hypothetical protein
MFGLMFKSLLPDFWCAERENDKNLYVFSTFTCYNVFAGFDSTEERRPYTGETYRMSNTEPEKVAQEKNDETKGEELVSEGEVEVKV